MIFLQASSADSAPIFLIFSFLLRIVGAIVCSSRAQDLNRSTGAWGFFGFMMPIVAMIWVYCMKPNVVWDSNVDSQTKSVKS
jgi:hypothetical protein